jgi:DNA invertase Pin-like site-specific DNA recombinase
MWQMTAIHEGHPGEPPVYSYGRFSDDPQSEGDSVRRQDDGAARWAQRNDKPLADHRRLFDKAASAYHGINRSDPERWALARFLAAVEAGDKAPHDERVARGSYLVIENLDRLTREKPVIGMTLLLNLISNGIRVVVLTPMEVTYDADAGGMQLMFALMELCRAHGESARKDDTISKWWQNRRERAQMREDVGGPLPGWLQRRESDGKVVPVPRRVGTLKRIFELVCQGWGPLRVCRAMVAEGREPFARQTKRKGKPGWEPAWRAAYIRLIVTDRRVLGEQQFYSRKPDRQPEGPPIPGYYPRVIERPRFDLAQVEMRKHAFKGSRERKHVNAFKGMLHDALDGSAMMLMKGRGELNYINVDGQLNGGTGRRFPRAVIEEAVLRELREISPADLRLDDRAGEADALEEQRKECVRELDGLAVELESGHSRTILAAVRKWEARLLDVEARLREAAARAARPAAAAWKDARSLGELWRQSDDRDALRLRLRSALRRLGCQGRVVVSGGARGAVRCACVQLRFAEPALTRTFLIVYRPAGRGRAVAAGVTSEVGVPTELSKREDAEALCGALRRLDLAALLARITPLEVG